MRSIRRQADWVLWQMLKAMKPHVYRDKSGDTEVKLGEDQIVLLAHAIKEAADAAKLDAKQKRLFERALKANLKALEEPA